MILDERGFDGFEDWAEQASLTLARFGAVPTIISHKDWRNWATQLLQLPGIAQQNPPAPNSYGHWRAWVADFNMVVN